MTLIGLTEPPPPDFAPLVLLETAVQRYWLSLLVLAVCLVLTGREEPGKGRRRGAWLALPILVQSWIATATLRTSLAWGSSQLGLFHDFFVAQLGLLLHALPIVVVLSLRRGRDVESGIAWLGAALLAVWAVILDHALFLLVLADFSAFSAGSS